MTFVAALVPVLVVLGTGGAAGARRAIPVAGVDTGVDGFPLLFSETGADAGLKLWVIGHHGYAPATDPKVSCLDAATGTPCPVERGGGSWPLALNTRPLPLNTSTPGDITTAQVPQFVTSRNRVFYPAVTRTALPGFPHGSVGAGCLNPQTRSAAPTPRWRR